MPEPTAKVIDLPPQFISSGGSGTAGDPWTDLHLPDWMLAQGYTTIFTTTGGYYNALEYDNIGFLAQLGAFIAEAATRYGDNPQLAAVRIYAGHEGETQPNKSQGGEDNTYFLQRAETVADCTHYKLFARTLAETAAQYLGNTPILLMAATDPCSSESGETFRAD